MMQWTRLLLAAWTVATAIVSLTASYAKPADLAITYGPEVQLLASRECALLAAPPSNSDGVEVQRNSGLLDQSANLDAALKRKPVAPANPASYAVPQGYRLECSNSVCRLVRDVPGQQPIYQGYGACVGGTCGQRGWFGGRRWR